jgi:DNA-binding CsgD family transcriptional regulator
VNHVLLPEEYEELLHFASIIAQPMKDIRSGIQHQLAVQFGYDKSIFWLSDNNGNLTNPLLHRLSDNILFDYINEFSCHDFLHPKKNFNLFLTKRALRLIDIVTPSAYEHSTFYRSFMKPHGYYDEMVISLVNEGQCLGVIGLARKQNEAPFSEKDCKRFLFLSNLIGATLSRQLGHDPSLLSKRETEVVQLVKEGKSNQQIAKELYISHNTVKKHLQNIFQKYSVQNKVQLIQKV